MIDARMREWALRHGVGGAALADLATLFEPTVRLDKDGSSEQRLQALLRMEAARRGAALWRNNNGATLDETGRVIRYGLGNDSKKINDVFKSSDLIGITPVDYAGYRFGVFTAYECKPPGWRGARTDHEIAQNNYMTTVAALGGIARFVTDVGEVWPVRG